MKRVISLVILIFILVGLISICSCSIVRADEGLKEDSGVISNDKDIKEFISNYFSRRMKQYSVPGAAIVVVKDNKEVFKKGYGYSSLDTLVDPDKTMFPAGSVSKLFTATAIMQLYEEGKIDLDKDVNYYIAPYKVENKYDKKVTCRNLLTHSSGLDEESELDVSTTNINSIEPQEYYFNKHPLKVLVEPDTICRYSNIGYNLLGYIIERTSGLNYEEYIKEKILKVLDMESSNVRLKNSNMASGHEYSDGEYKELPFSYQYTSGSSGIISTVTDMENFITANLNNGVFKDKSILKGSTINLMHDRQFSNDEVFSGMGFGFIRSFRNNVHVIKHEGGLASGYTTTLFMIPEENLGVYVATNSLTGLPFDFEEEFLNYFFPCESSFDIDNRNLNKDYSKYEGSYRSYDGIAKSNVMKVTALFDEDMEVKDNKDGTLTLKELTQRKELITTKLVEEDKGVFLRKDGRGKFVFKCDGDGNVTYAFNDVSINSFEKLKFYETKQFILAAIAIILIIYLINIILSLIKRRAFKQLSIYIEVFNITGSIGAVTLIINMCLTGEFNLSAYLYFFLSLLIISSIIATCNIAVLIYSFIKKKGSRRLIYYHLILSLADLGFIFLLNYFNLLGYKLF